MRKKKEVFAETVVGAFMLAVLLLLGYFTIVVSGVDILAGHNRVPIRVTFTDVGGLKEHDSVMYRGTKVGTVERVAVTVSNLVVTAHVDAEVVLRGSYRISVGSTSMLGGSYLLLEEGLGDKLPLDRTEFQGETPIDWMRDVAEIARNIRQITERGEIDKIFVKLDASASSVSNILARIERGEGTVGRLINDRELVDEAERLVKDVRQVIDNYRDTTPITTFSSLLMGGL